MPTGGWGGRCVPRAVFPLLDLSAASGLVFFFLGYLKFSVRQEPAGGMREGGPAPGAGEDALSPSGKPQQNAVLSPKNTAISPGVGSAFHGAKGWILPVPVPSLPCILVTHDVSERGDRLFLCLRCNPRYLRLCTSAPPPALFLAANSWNNYFRLSPVGSLDLELSRSCCSESWCVRGCSTSDSGQRFRHRAGG